ncbi:agmatinase [Acidaminobacter sp. JC074]|uniref:agmatinase n=1 Tax=Acidaminobacter sp. JC074 TaxID=2530199 RepID=UPI001F10E5CA|nr:agmatinase [Acidaminobacter sp. JC074]MCH4888068.1 agmatinase [Acidaminobacter sp. JC074]
MNIDKGRPFMAMDHAYEQSEVVVFGIPFDGTTSYRPGTRFGPMHVRNESEGIETYSPYLDMDLEDHSIHDAGDMFFPLGEVQTVLSIIETYTDGLVKDHKKPVMIGGEHLVTLPVVKSVFKKYPDMHIIHLDAHADVRQDYMGQKFSHATVIRRVADFVSPGKIHQYGIRSGEKSEFEWAKEHTDFNPFSLESIKKLKDILGDTPVYVTIDLDVLDPSIFPGTGTPEPGGITYKELIKALVFLSSLNIVGADIVELSPHYDHSGMSTAVACKTLRELVLAVLK